MCVCVCVCVCVYLPTGGEKGISSLFLAMSSAFILLLPTGTHMGRLQGNESVHLNIRERGWLAVCVCVCVCVFESECVFEKECACVSVCLRKSVCVCV